MGKRRSFATNFSADLYGQKDERPDTWGRADFRTWQIKFAATFRRIRIVRAYGDFLIWPTGSVVPGEFAGALFGLQTTAAEGSKVVDLGADNTMLYVQVATGGEPARAQFDSVVSGGGLLEKDGVLAVKMATFLNDTERIIHCEASFVVEYELETAGGGSR